MGYIDRKELYYTDPDTGKELPLTREGALTVGSLQKKFRDNFIYGTESLKYWDIHQENTTGQPGSMYFLNNEAVIDSGGIGTQVNETGIITKDSFTIPFKLSCAVQLSQRIANQSFIVEVVSVDPETGLPDGQECAAIVFDGTTATQGKHRVTSYGYTVDSAAVTFPSTVYATNPLVVEIEASPDEVWFHGSTADSTSARTNSYRRNKMAPRPNKLYKIRLKWVNNGSVTQSTAKVNFVAIQDHTEITAEIVAGRGQSVAGQAVGVQVAGGTVTASGVTGNVAHDSAVSGNPVRIGGRALTANYTGVGTGDVADFITTVVGAQVVRPFSIPELDWQYQAATPVAVTTDQVMKAAGATGIRNYLTGLQMKNTSATATEVVVKDGSTVIWRGHLSASMTSAEIIQFHTPLRGTAATALNFACITAGASVYVSAQGYQAP